MVTRRAERSIATNGRLQSSRLRTRRAAHAAVRPRIDSWSWRRRGDSTPNYACMRETRSAPATPGGGRLTPPHQGPRIRAETSATSAERRRTRPRRGRDIWRSRLSELRVPRHARTPRPKCCPISRSEVDSLCSLHPDRTSCCGAGGHCSLCEHTSQAEALVVCDRWHEDCCTGWSP